MGPSILFLVFTLFFGVLWLLYGWQGFIIFLSCLGNKSVDCNLPSAGEVGKALGNGWLKPPELLRFSGCHQWWACKVMRQRKVQTDAQGEETRNIAHAPTAYTYR